jgi:oligopeptide transport system permease protein
MSQEFYQQGVRAMMRRSSILAALFLLILMVLLALFVPWISPYGYDEIRWESMNASPQFAHWCGTDNLGRDLCTRIAHGGRVSLAVGILATLVSVGIGVVWGAVAGFVGGRVEMLMMRVVDVLYALPFIFLVILLTTMLGRNLVNLFIALGAVQWLTMARMVHGQVRVLMRREFVEAARALGVGSWTILRRHLLRHLAGTVVVYATLMVPTVILEETFLSFLGLGVQPPMASWGGLIAEGAKSLGVHGWQLLIPALIMVSTLLALNTLGDGLRDALDPKTPKL